MPSPSKSTPATAILSVDTIENLIPHQTTEEARRLDHGKRHLGEVIRELIALRASAKQLQADLLPDGEPEYLHCATPGEAIEKFGAGDLRLELMRGDGWKGGSACTSPRAAFESALEWALFSDTGLDPLIENLTEILLRDETMHLRHEWRQILGAPHRPQPQLAR